MLTTITNTLPPTVEITVTHSEGTTTKTIPSVADLLEFGDISVGSFNFGNCEPKVTITHTSKKKGGETDEKVKSSKVLPFSHSSFRRLAALPSSYNWSNSNSGCASEVGNQGSCGSCYAWTAVGIANERECRTGRAGNSVRHLACKGNDAFGGRNGGCEGGWVDQSLNYMKNTGVCTKRDVPW